MNGGRTSSSRLLRTDDIRRYLERKDLKSKARRWSVCSDESDSSAVSDTSLRSLPQYSSYRALSAQGSLTSMSQISSPTSSLHTPSKLKQPSVTRKALNKDGHDSAIPTVNSPIPGILSVSRENSFTKGGTKGSGIPTPNMSRENSFTKVEKMKRESSLPSIKRETSKTALKESRRLDLSSSEILKREKAPAKKEPPPVRPRQGAIPASGAPLQLGGSPVSTFTVGDRVEIIGSQKKGVIQFIGETKFAKGSWAGIVLDESCGKNDGSVGGVRYFQCAPNYGVFVKVDKLKKDSGLSAPLKARLKGEGGIPSITSKDITVNASKIELVSNVDTLDLKPGDRVTIGENRVGTVRYLGNAGFAQGLWCGVELDEPHGKNDGAVAGTRYFECQPKYGLFSPVHKVKKLQTEPGVKQEKTLEVVQEPSVSNEENRSVLLGEDPPDHVLAPAIPEPSPIISAKPEPSPVASVEVFEAHKQLVANLQNTIAKLEKEKSETELLVEEEKRKCEDLQFQLEEQLLIGAETNKEDNEEKLSELQEIIGLKDQELHQLKEEVKKTQLSEESFKETITKLELSLQDYQRRETSINSNAESDRTRIHQLEDLLQSKDKELEEISFLSKEEIFIKEEEIKQLTDQYDEQCKLFSIAKEETAQLQIELCSRKEKETEDARKYEELKRTFDEQNDLITTLQKELNELKQEHSGCACKMEALESRIEHMRSEKQTLEKEMKSTIQASGDFSEQLEKLSDQVIQKSRELTDMNTEVSVLKKEKAALQARLEEYKGLESSKNKEIEKIKGDLSNRDKHLSELKEEMKQSSSKLTEVLTQQSKSSQAMGELQQKLAASKEELSSVHKAKESAEQHCTAVTRQFDALKSDYSNLLEKLRLSENEVQACRTEVDHMKLNMNEGSGKVDQLHRDMNVIKSELQAAQEKLAAARDDCRAMEMNYSSACAERDRVNDELEKKIFEYDQLKVETEVMVEEERNISERERTRCEALDNDRLNLQNKVEQTLRQLQTKEGDLASAKSQIQELERQLMSERSQRMKLEASVSSGSTSHGTNNVKANGGDKDKEIEFLNSVIVELQKKNKDLEAKLVIFESEGLVTSETLGLEPSDLNQSGLRAELRPRLFCDICDVFDEHDTEDCPQQSSEADAGSKHHGIRGEERPFCTICEMFGHEAINCEDDLMF